MNCPRCQTPLNHQVHQEINQQLEYLDCPSCKGMWMSKTTLNALEKIHEAVVFEMPHINKNVDQLIGLKCPSCAPSILMKKAEHPRDKRVIMDYCESCEGIWLDQGELEAIQKEGVLDSIAKFLGLY